jgi:hypothetical protein
MGAKLKLPARSKYRAKPTVIDGHRFHSKKEAERYCELKIMIDAGAITALRLQPSFDLIVNGQLICKYVADFDYYNWKDGIGVVEDCKGYRTPVYGLKKKLMKALHGITILET